MNAKSEDVGELIQFIYIQNIILNQHNTTTIKDSFVKELSKLSWITKAEFLEKPHVNVITVPPQICIPVKSHNYHFGDLVLLINNYKEYESFQIPLLDLVKIFANTLHEKSQIDGSATEITTDITYYLESQKRFTDLLNKMNLMSVILDESGNITNCNNYLLCQTLYSSEEIIGKNWFDTFLDKKYRLKEKHAFYGVIEGDRITTNFENEILTKDGERLWISWNNTVLLNKNRKIIGIASIGENISKRKIAETALLKKNIAFKKLNEEYLLVNEELKESLLNQKKIIKQLEISKSKAEESDRLKTAFLQNMSHEIRTPLNAIMGFSELLVHFYNNREKLDHFSQIIFQRCDDLLKIINDVLDIAKIESGQQNVNFEECNLEELFFELRAFFKEYQRKLNKDNISFEIIDSCPTEGCVIITDKVKLKQILINLINNAFKYTHEGYIQVGCTLEDNNLHFYISDTGIGIAEEKLKQVFDRFTQVQPDIKLGGTGLGLSIVQGLLSLLNGRITVKSELGKGSTFSFILPYKVAVNFPN